MGIVKEGIGWPVPDPPGKGIVWNFDYGTCDICGRTVRVQDGLKRCKNCEPNDESGEEEPDGQ